VVLILELSRNVMIGKICVATSSARVYYAIVTRLRRADLSFTSAFPDSDCEGCALVLCSGAEAVQFGDRAVAFEDLNDILGVFKGQLLSKLDGANGILLVGVDPGVRIGLAVFYGETNLEYSTFGSAAWLSHRVGAFMRGVPAKKSVVRVGNGSPAISARILELLKGEAQEATIEAVDESGTSVRRVRMKGIQGDQVAAARIAFRKGEVVTLGNPRNRSRALPGPGRKES
jgi:hypothetical protein